MAAFVTHPSVRIRGTENNYEPIVCIYSTCADKPAHMHCPFCVKTELFHDQAILKAHYRVKHVDKGLEFAGLRILRCCDHCDIVGTIKGEKKFKGPHWHCYKCRNGFNRRDEAIKHYRTHFRNPQTTFQIQVTQEVNVMLNSMNQADGQEVVDGVSTEPSTEYTVHQSALGAGGETLVVGSVVGGCSTATLDGYYTSGGDASSGKNGGGAMVAANETIDMTSDETQTIVIVDERSTGDAFPSSTIQTDQIPAYEELLQHKAYLEKTVQELRARIQELEMTRSLADRLKVENDQLRQQLGQRADRDACGSSSSSRSDLNNGCSKVDDLVEQLQKQHKELILAQLQELQSDKTLKYANSSIEDNPTAKRKKVS